ncbi:ATP phosphoribosyltransferase regulatory subunit [Thioclava sp. SK-1]|uniref:ATP phosphoribosyltransferase regulatory subunit n=1 Tax=Thioclava sp. SK-1 TaxID=1889770 RepID=UPI000826BDF9|nr:ATP phosphoribosyltransferase regulatory subunit [Thioclava sp. SK-1]OCX66633.1 ATP phosphoribosyltransferase regulatory subunit [Thioclava sp. SK-1]
MATKAQARITGRRLLQSFAAAGAQEIEPDIMQPAEVLLDLYGEDIRARAYVTQDPTCGEMMLRPDFTVPVVQAHMSQGAEPARYCYMGEVFRKQDHFGQARVNEYTQVGYEVFDREDPANADAEVFALFSSLLRPHGLQATMGDMGLLRAAVVGLETTQARKAALLRHIWRPVRFRKLLERYSGQTPMPQARRDLLAGARTKGPWIGLRSPKDMDQRIASLREDAKAPPLPAQDVARIEALYTLTCPAAQASAQLRTLNMPVLDPAIDLLEARLAALRTRRVDLEALRFDASHGRTTMEYYDGFTFTFETSRRDWPAVASGGRYDALTRVLGQGREIPAVGGVIRPGLLADLEGAAQ